VKAIRRWFANPWGKPRALLVITWTYVLWSLVPVAIAVLFSFNSGRSRSVWQGFSLRWYWTDPFLSVRNDPTLRTALVNSLVLAVLTMCVAVPLGMALALGMGRWRSRTARATRVGTLMPLVTPEIVLGTALFLVFTNLYDGIPLGRPAQLAGHVTLSLTYVVVITRSRLLTIGPDLELAARDLGATPLQAVRLVLLPLLGPAVVASAVIVFATSIDDFVVSAFLTKGAQSDTVPVKLYSSIRGGATPALNALATLMLVATIGALIVVFTVIRGVRRRSGDEDASASALRTVADFELG
jgi:spermidine/putrescine transport system permease protein